jgi:hypothetical protein
MRIVTLVLGGTLACAPVAGAGDPGRSYTNEDLERVAARRAETGVASVPAFGPGPQQTATGGVHDEAYWRREAERLRDQLRPLRQRALGLQLRIEHPAPETRKTKTNPQPAARGQQRRSPTPTPAPTRAESDRTAALRDQLRALEDQIRDREARLEERARREGALPGWLR